MSIYVLNWCFLAHPFVVIEIGRLNRQLTLLSTSTRGGQGKHGRQGTTRQTRSQLATYLPCTLSKTYKYGPQEHKDWKKQIYKNSNQSLRKLPTFFCLIFAFLATLKIHKFCKPLKTVQIQS